MNKGAKNRVYIEYLRASYLSGKITLDEAKEQLQPLIDEINKKGKEIAKEHNKTFRPLTFGYLFR